MQQMAGQMAEVCTKQNMKRDGNSYVSESECSLGTSKVRSRAVFKGDFSSNYEGEISSQFDPPFMGKREGTTKVSARWIGECEAGQQPGDIIMPNGMRMNMSMMEKMAKSARPAQ